MFLTWLPGTIGVYSVSLFSEIIVHDMLFHLAKVGWIIVILVPRMARVVDKLELYI